MLYATAAGQVGCLVDYSGQGTHTKYSTISVSPQQCPEYAVPTGYTPERAGVCISSSILQRILREYKTIPARLSTQAGARQHPNASWSPATTPTSTCPRTRAPGGRPSAVGGDDLRKVFP